MNNDNKHTVVLTVNNVLEARETIMKLRQDGYPEENIFVLSHDKTRTEHVVDETDANKIGVAEEGVLTAIANLFRSTGDGLRAKLTAMGVSKEHANLLEKDMDNGKIVILAWSGTTYYDDKHDDNIRYMTPYDSMPLL
jgi:hypothetical protein